MKAMKRTGVFSALVMLVLVGVTGSVAQHPNIRISLPADRTPEEVTIAINPVDPRFLAAGANINYSYLSTDAGMTWSTSRLVSPSFGVWGDPSVIYDDEGSLYYAHLSNPPAGGYWIDRIVVQKSTDNGLTWDDGYGIGYNPPLENQDKEWLAADCTGSPYHGNVYVAWTQFDQYGSSDPADSSRILFARSTDHGYTWSAPVRVSDKAGNCVDSDSTVEGATPAIGPNGEIYLCWGGPDGLRFDKSLDGGVTWGTDKLVATQPGGWDFYVPGIYRCNGMPVVACDAGTSSHRGTIYINWSDQRDGAGNTDVFLIRSTDGGATWSSLTRVNNDTTYRHQFFTWMTVDQSDGNVYVVFYDRRNTTGNATDVVLAKSTDGGRTFSNSIISDSSFTPREGVFFGDYTNIAAVNGVVYPVWMELDSASSELSVWTAIIRKGARITCSAAGGWNMLSVPVRMTDSAGSTIFPGSISKCFSYDGKYVVRDYLVNGSAYWVKYPSGGPVVFTGDSLAEDSVPVSGSWNMIGTISVPVAVSSIASIPPGIVVSGFFTYNGSSYVPVDTLVPGHGYWVKSGSAGTLLLSANTQSMKSGQIRIIADSELPPSPPAGDYDIAQQSQDSPAASHFALDRTYPNPFNPSTTVSYVIGRQSFVRLNVYDMFGRTVAVLVNEMKQPGTYRAVWRPAGDIPSGVYFCRLMAGNFSDVRRMVLMR